jgi:hypothetical protein
MNVFLWILQILLGGMMLMAGAMKLMQGKARLAEDPRMGWVEDYSDSTVRGVGAAEVAAGIGLIFPWWLDIAPILTPLAALGVIAVQIGAIMTHRRRGETQMLAMNGAIAIVALVVAIGRFGDL